MATSPSLCTPLGPFSDMPAGEPIQDGRIYTEKINDPFLFERQREASGADLFAYRRSPKIPKQAHRQEQIGPPRMIGHDTCRCRTVSPEG